MAPWLSDIPRQFRRFIPNSLLNGTGNLVCGTGNVGGKNRELPQHASGRMRFWHGHRRECLDHLIIVSEKHLRRVMLAYADYYNNARTHLSLGKDAPNRRAVMHMGKIKVIPHLGGLHHQYVRIYFWQRHVSKQSRTSADYITNISGCSFW
jgi:hypothetical protein